MAKRTSRRAKGAAIASLWLLIIGIGRAYDWSYYHVEDFEEPAGTHSLFEFNPADELYGAGVGDGTWLKGAPILGDYFLSCFWNGKEEALYAGGGLTLRLMPRWSFAPFVGGGGSYNQVLASNAPHEVSGIATNQGESYWGGHAESGVRIRAGRHWYEVLVRYVWSSSHIEDPDYWLLRLAYGIPLGRSGREDEAP
jgi:hypothetical protein